MSEILAYMPTYAPDTEACTGEARPYTRLTHPQIAERVNRLQYLSRLRPWMYMDVIDSIVNVRPDIELVVADARSTNSMRDQLSLHQKASGGYALALYSDKASQWWLMNDVVARHATPNTKYVIYTSSDILWTMDWVAEALKEFDKDPTLQILFPCVSSGDDHFLPCQVAPGPQDTGLIDPPYQDAARAPVLNGYVFIMRREFLEMYGGYPTVFRNCFTESFLYYMCEAMGGRMRLMPRGWCYHHNGGDAWTGPGGSYHYTAEKPLFDEIMDKVQEARAGNRMSVSFLKGLLYV